MKKKLLSVLALALTTVSAFAGVTTWDFSKFTDQVTLAGDNYTVEYNGLTLVGNTNSTYTNDIVSARAGFRMNGTSSSTTRYIKYTPFVDGTMTVTYRSNSSKYDKRITAIGTSVITGTDVATLLKTDGVLAADTTNAATQKTISARLKAGTTYYFYMANGGQSIMKLAYAYAPKLQSTYPETNRFIEACPEYFTMMFDDEIVNDNIKQVHINISTQGGEGADIDLSKVSVIDGNTIKITDSQYAVLTSGIVTIAVIYDDAAAGEQRYELCFTIQPALAIQNSNVAEGWINYNQNIGLVDGVEEATATVLDKYGLKVCDATLTLDDEAYNGLVVTLPALYTGDYKLVIPASTVVSTTTEMMNNEETLSFAIEDNDAPVLQSTYPQTNTSVEACPEYFTLMFNKEITKDMINKIHIYLPEQGGEGADIDMEKVSIIDGNTIKISDDQYAALSSGSVNIGVLFNYINTPYEMFFTIQPALDVQYNGLNDDDKVIVFTQHIDFFDSATEATAAIMKDGVNVGLATLILNDEEYNTVNVSLPAGLAGGDYTLVIAPSTIVTADQYQTPNSEITLNFTVESTGPVAPVITKESDTKYTVTNPNAGGEIFYIWDNAAAVADPFSYVDAFSLYNSYYGITTDGLAAGEHTLYVLVIDGNTGAISYAATTTVTIVPSAINFVKGSNAEGKMYNLAGQRVNNAKCIVIINGKKMIK